MDQIGHFFNLIFTYPIFNALMLLLHLFNDLGLSIIVLTIIIRLVLFPLTLKQIRSSKAMQVLQPQIAELRKKYKDQQQQAAALQTLYKEHGVNPLSGCLPLLVQLPVLYGLYYALSNVIRNASLTSINNIIYPFLPHFSKFPNIDLGWFTFINAAWHISLGQPDPTHILPVLAGIATFVQLRMSQPKSVSGSKDAMSQQMKIMQYIMPLITTYFAWQFAAGLALYWTTSSIFGMVQQYFVTGWGSLLNIPNLTGNTAKNSAGESKTYTGDAKKETKLLEGANETVEDGPVGRNLRTKTSQNGSTSARRRSRTSSASARRRGGGNVPKRNPSRS